MSDGEIHIYTYGSTLIRWGRYRADWLYLVTIKSVCMTSQNEWSPWEITVTGWSRLGRQLENTDLWQLLWFTLTVLTRINLFSKSNMCHSILTYMEMRGQIGWPKRRQREHIGQQLEQWNSDMIRRGDIVFCNTHRDWSVSPLTGLYFWSWELLLSSLLLWPGARGA